MIFSSKTIDEQKGIKSNCHYYIRINDRNIRVCDLNVEQIAKYIINNGGQTDILAYCTREQMINSYRDVYQVLMLTKQKKYENQGNKIIDIIEYMYGGKFIRNAKEIVKAEKLINGRTVSLLEVITDLLEKEETQEYAF